MSIPPAIAGQKYIQLTTFRKNGTAIPTPIWFAEDGDKLYVVTRADSGKVKRIRNNPQVKIAPCTIRGKVTGPEFTAVARVLPPEDWPAARKIVNKKYFFSRLSLQPKKNVYLEVSAIGG